MVLWALWTQIAISKKPIDNYQTSNKQATSKQQAINTSNTINTINTNSIEFHTLEISRLVDHHLQPVVK